MKPIVKALILLATLLLLISCEKERMTDPEVISLGKWVYVYELREDGTRDFENPYALLEFEYSDGFILNEDGTGHSIWYDNINDDFTWRRNGGILTFVVEHPDGTIDEYEYHYSPESPTSLFFDTPEGRTYLMELKED
ncbi:hypothetical protein [Lewinella sp. W8]|uniref:hypothetical protein n=1 Tax=Lewinella sp. W8 TaxID=2528208 RepID=UPI00106820B9|nr:hypothetical protein [Lewinella sp. W8]MTB50751.1 hypothetical protein [Lewinella sp. W8]